MKPLFMEEHHEAYFAWKREGFRDAWCWHVDAHLDIGKTGLGRARLEALEPCRTSEEARQAGLMGNSYLPWGGLHCGNYLYPAITEGIVSKLSWVIPPDLPEGSLLTWGRGHLNDWFELSLAEFDSLQVGESGALAGTLLGIPFEMGTLEQLGVPEQPVLLDVDLDYFLTEEGEAWQDSAEFLEHISSLESLFTTVAFSVVGGFTPDGERRLSEPFGDPRGSLDAPYLAEPIDELAALVRCHKYEEALEFGLVEGWDVESKFLRGTSLQATDRMEEALQIWRELLNSPNLEDDAAAYLHGLCSEILLEFKRLKEALEHSLAGQAADREDYRHLWTEAVAREGLGEIRKTIKLLRRIVRKAESQLFGLKARYALSRVYRDQGKEGLARIELQKLAQLDVTGQFQAVVLL